MVTADFLLGFKVGWACCAIFFVVMFAVVWLWWRHGRR